MSSVCKWQGFEDQVEHLVKQRVNCWLCLSTFTKELEESNKCAWALNPELEVPASGQKASMTVLKEHISYSFRTEVSENHTERLTVLQTAEF